MISVLYFVKGKCNKTNERSAPAFKIQFAKFQRILYVELKSTTFIYSNISQMCLIKCAGARRRLLGLIQFPHMMKY